LHEYGQDQDLGDQVSDVSKWTLVDGEGGQTHRLKEPGGYLHRTVLTAGGTVAVAMAFVSERKRVSRVVPQLR
jgi:hypothetical protein